MKKFGQIKSTIDSLLIEAVNKNDNKIVKKYITLLKENKVLRDLFNVYHNIQNAYLVNENEITHYINTNMKVLETYPKKVLRESIKKLQKLVGSKDKVLKEGDILVHIDNMVFTNRNGNNVNTLHESFVAVRDFIKENAPIERSQKKVSIKLLTKLAAKKFNERFDSLNETEREMFKSLQGSSEGEKKEVYNKILAECIDSINNKLSEANDLTTKEKLLETKDIIYRLEYSDETFTENLMKIYNLKDNLG